MYETSRESESCAIAAVTVGVFKLIASVLCSQSVFEVGTIAQKLWLFYDEHSAEFSWKIFQKYFFFAYIRAGEAA